MKLPAVIIAALAATCAFTQNVLSSQSMTGSVAATTQSGLDVYTRGGSPRSGYYWYWRPTTKQTTSASVDLAFNASTGTVFTTGTYYSPFTSVWGSGSVSFSNTPTSATWSISAFQSADPLPTFPAHQWENASVTVSPRFYFTVPNDTDVTITLYGDAAISSNIYALSGEVQGSESGKPNTYTVTAGGSYCFWATSTLNAASGFGSLADFQATLQFSRAGG